MCKTKQGSKLVDMEEAYVSFFDINEKEYLMSKKSLLAVMADYVFEIDDNKNLRVLHSPEYWLPKEEDIV